MPPRDDNMLPLTLRRSFLAAGNSQHTTFASYKTGEAVPGEGIFIGSYEPSHSKTGRLNCTFNIFAAPRDLAGGEERTFSSTLKYLADLKGWHGHDGEAYASADAFFAAMKNGKYKGGWVVPPIEVVTGNDRDGGQKMPMGISRALSQRSLQWLWTCTPPASAILSDNRYGVLADDTIFPFMTDVVALPCRPVRYVPAY